MRRKVSIQISGKQKYSEGHEGGQELITKGIYFIHNDAFYLICQDAGIGFEGTTTISIKDGLVKLKRTGQVKSRQEFQEGVLNKSTYSTCYGEVWLSVLPNLVEYDLTVQGGRISLNYDLFVNDNFVSTNVLLLNIKEEAD